MNDCFISKNYIMDNIKNISDIPATIIQGRHDVICPPFKASMLSNAWNAAEIEIIEDAGHSAFEVNISRKLINALHMIK